MVGRMTRSSVGLSVVVLLFSVSAVAHGQDTLTVTNPGAGSVSIPAGYEWTDVTVQCWAGGGGGGGGFPNSGTWYGGGGGGGGAYASNTYPTLVSGSYNYYIGAGGAVGAGYGNGIPGGNTIWNYGGAKIFTLRVVAAATIGIRVQVAAARAWS